MPSSLETQSQDLRTRIARSRRRLDRHARSLVSDVTGWTSGARLVARSSHRSLLGALAAGIALARWISRRGGLDHSLPRHLGSSLVTWLKRLLRHIRVAAWRSRRTAGGRAPEVMHD